MPHPPNPLDRPRSQAVHLASQLKQLELRANAGKPPTTAQLHHVANIVAMLSASITQAMLVSEARDQRDLQRLLTTRPTIS